MGKKKIDKKKLMGWIIIILMVLSVFGIVGSFFAQDPDSANKVEYNGFILYNRTSLWQMQSGDQWYTFQYFPSELENLSLTSNLGEWLNTEKVYLGYVPNDELNVENHLNSIGLVLYNMKIIPQKACAEEKDCPDIPILNCDENVGIIMQSGQESSIITDKKCLVLIAEDEEELRKLTERVIYSLLGVI